MSHWKRFAPLHNNLGEQSLCSLLLTAAATTATLHCYYHTTTFHKQKQSQKQDNAKMNVFRLFPMEFSLICCIQLNLIYNPIYISICPLLISLSSSLLLSILLPPFQQLSFKLTELSMDKWIADLVIDWSIILIDLKILIVYLSIKHLFISLLQCFYLKLFC